MSYDREVKKALHEQSDEELAQTIIQRDAEMVTAVEAHKRACAEAARRDSWLDILWIISDRSR